MIDNLKEIERFLIFESKDDFYYLQILQRKKENPQLGSNNRVIKNYYINSLEYLEERYEEIKQLCIIFNARAMLRLNKRSYEKVAFKALINLSNSMSNREYSFTKKSYDRACGLSHNDSNKKWILDIDEKLTYQQLEEIENEVNNALPIGKKTLGYIKSKNGMHLLTKPFNKTLFNFKYREIEIHKDNPVNLFIP